MPAHLPGGIVFELFAFRRRDLADVESVVMRRGTVLDWDYIERQLALLTEVNESSEIMEALARLRRSLR